MNLLHRFKTDFNFQIKILQIINIILTLTGIIYLVVDFNWYYFSVAMISFLWFGVVGANAGLHRYFSHHSFNINRFWQLVLAITGTLCSLGSIISWVAVHRYHHLHADTEQDPHSPKYIGARRAYTYDWKRTNISKKFIKDVISDSAILFLHRHYFKVIATYLLILSIIDPWLIIYAYAIPATGCLNGVSAVTVIGHIHGYTSHKVNDTSKNSWVACIMSLGEGWHNNHHAHPYNWRQGERWWEIDPPAFVINIIRNKT